MFAPPPLGRQHLFFIMGGPILRKLENRGCPLPGKLKNMGRRIFGAKIWYVVKIWYHIYPKYSDTVNVETRYSFLKRHLFHVPYISGHVPNRVFLLSINVRTHTHTQKTCHLFLIKLPFFTTEIFWLHALFTCVSSA